MAGDKTLHRYDRTESDCLKRCPLPPPSVRRQTHRCPLSGAKCSNDTDEFCIMIDRDMLTHSEQDMKDSIEHCRNAEHPYHCFIANPCFEFWLLLHLSDVQTEYADRLALIHDNLKVSAHHTFVSREVSQKAHHGKSNIKFKYNYLPHVQDAVSRAKAFASTEDELINNIGCNVWKLIESMQRS